MARIYYILIHEKARPSANKAAKGPSVNKSEAAKPENVQQKPKTEEKEPGE